MAEHISNNPQFIVNGFICARISRALDGYRYETEDLENETEELPDDSEENLKVKRSRGS